MLLSKENFRTWFIDDFLMLLMLVSRSGQEDFEKWLLYYLEGYTWGCCSWLIKKKDHTSLSYLLVFLFSFFFFPIRNIVCIFLLQLSSPWCFNFMACKQWMTCGLCRENCSCWNFTHYILEICFYHCIFLSASFFM